MTITEQFQSTKTLKKYGKYSCGITTFKTLFCHGNKFYPANYYMLICFLVARSVIREFKQTMTTKSCRAPPNNGVNEENNENCTCQIQTSWFLCRPPQNYVFQVLSVKNVVVRR